MNLYFITAAVEGVGPIQHASKGKDSQDAQERIHRAYPGRAVIIQRIVRAKR